VTTETGLEVPAVSPSHICLTSDSSECVWRAIAAGGAVAVIANITNRVMDAVFSKKGDDNHGDDEDEIEDNNDKDSEGNDLCLASTALRPGENIGRELT
jgi:hypothetical protein